MITAVIEREMIRQTLALECRIVNTGQDAPASRVVFDIIEQHCGRRIGLSGNLGNRADLLIPIGVFDYAQLAE